MSTPPRANRSAMDMAHTVGSSSTRSAPQDTAISALDSLSVTAKPPRWVKFPLMAQTTASAPASRACAIRYAWPVWSGSYSQMMPATDIAALLVFVLAVFYHKTRPYCNAPLDFSRRRSLQ